MVFIAWRCSEVVGHARIGFAGVMPIGKKPLVTNFKLEFGQKSRTALKQEKV